MFLRTRLARDHLGLATCSPRGLFLNMQLLPYRRLCPRIGRTRPADWAGPCQRRGSRLTGCWSDTRGLPRADQPAWFELHAQARAARASTDGQVDARAIHTVHAQRPGCTRKPAGQGMHAQSPGTRSPPPCTRKGSAAYFQPRSCTRNDREILPLACTRNARQRPAYCAPPPLESTAAVRAPWPPGPCLDGPFRVLHAGAFTPEG